MLHLCGKLSTIYTVYKPFIHRCLCQCCCRLCKMSHRTLQFNNEKNDFKLNPSYILSTFSILHQSSIVPTKVKVSQFFFFTFFLLFFPAFLLSVHSQCFPVQSAAAAPTKAIIQELLPYALRKWLSQGGVFINISW